MGRGIYICICLGFFLMFGCADEIIFSKAKTRLDLVDSSLALWSGVGPSLAWCNALCAGEPKCASLFYNKTDKSCKIFNMLHQVEDSTEDLDYYVIVRANNRRLPESCADLAACSGISTDGEYWLYPNATSGQRVKVYCHNMGTNPTEYITLKQANTFVEHDSTSWIIASQCQSSHKTPLKRAIFAKIAIDIKNMTVVGTDYTFATRTGDFQLPYGKTADCNGENFRSNCPYFGDAVIDTRGTGVILDQNIIFGKRGWATSIRNFQRSANGTEISFQCQGWCGKCGPTTEPIQLVLSSEIVASVEATSVVCIV